MAYTSGNLTPCLWADLLVEQHAPYNWAVEIYLPKTDRASKTRCYGHADCGRKLIQLCCANTEPTNLHTWVVLHEIAHAIHFHSRWYKPRRKYAKGRRFDHHPLEFWKLAVVLFDEYDVLGVAVEREYKKGQKFIRDYMDRRPQNLAAKKIVKSFDTRAF